MQVSVIGELEQVNHKLDGMNNKVYQEGSEIRTEITKDGERTREALRQALTSSGKSVGHLTCLHCHINAVYQKSKGSDTLPTPDLMRT